MADIRFKIDGNNPPFVVDVGRNGSFFRTEIFEFSGATNGNIKDEGYTCAIITNLSLSTTYDVKVTDKIGNVSSITQITTPSLPITIPVEKTISLGGQIIDVGTNRQISSPQPSYLIIDPPLESGEAFNICLSSDYISDVVDNPSSFVELCKFCANTGQNVLLYRLDDSTLSTGSIDTRMIPGDEIYYNLNAAISAEPTQSESSRVTLEIENTTLCSDIDNITLGSPIKLVASVSCDVVTTTTTTSTTTESPTAENVYIGITLADGSDKSIEDTNYNDRYEIPSQVLTVWFSTADIYDSTGSGTGFGPPLADDVSFSLDFKNTSFGDNWSTLITGVESLDGVNTESYPGFVGERTINGTIPAGVKQGSFQVIFDNTQSNYSFNVRFDFTNGNNNFQTLPLKGTYDFGWESSSTSNAIALLGLEKPA